MKTNHFVGWQALSMEQYHSLKEAIGSTSLKTIVNESPREYYYEMNTSDEDSESHFDIGKCLHAVVLEQNANAFKEGPVVSTKNTNIWKEAKAEAAKEGKILLSPEEYQLVMRGFESFCEHPLAHKLVSQCQTIESSGFYVDEETGLWLKFRPDGYCANDTRGDFIFDYKTARGISDRDIAKSIQEYGYHISAAHYIEGIKAITGREIKDYYFAWQKSSGAMDTRITLLHPDDLELGKEIRRSALRMIAECKLKEYWPGVSDKVEIVKIPDYGYSKANEYLKKEVV